MDFIEERVGLVSAVLAALAATCAFTRCRFDSELGRARVCQNAYFNEVDMAGHFASGRQLYL